MCFGLPRPKRLLATIVAAVLLLTAIEGAAGGNSFLIEASASGVRLGDFRVGWNATYASALAVLGPSTSCTLGREAIGHASDPTSAKAAWPRLGVLVELKTYGGLAAGQTGCTAPRAIYVHPIRITDAHWLTRRELHVGSRSSDIKRSYPAARATRAVPGWYGSGYWLVTRNVGGYEGIGGTNRSKAPVLVAETASGRVTALVLVIGAEGD